MWNIPSGKEGSPEERAGSDNRARLDRLCGFCDRCAPDKSSSVDAPSSSLALIGTFPFCSQCIKILDLRAISCQDSQLNARYNARMPLLRIRQMNPTSVDRCGERNHHVGIVANGTPSPLLLFTLGSFSSIAGRPTERIPSPSSLCTPFPIGFCPLLAQGGPALFV